ncbi:MAG: YecA family protein [Methanobacterium formicicum]|uniref:YecA family protein n=1 Tax=Methanobacterium formicicum TaxID=2162 RepID=UPI003530906A
MSNRPTKKIGNNEPCPCGSGKKYKKCCRSKDRAKANNSSKYKAKVINADNDLISDNPSAKKMKNSLESAKALRSANEKGLFDVFSPLCLDTEKLGDILSGIDELEEMMYILEIPDKFNQHFSKRGWIAHESINHEVMEKAVELADKGQINEAESILIDKYSENLEINIQMIHWMEQFKPRINLLELAYEDYLAERYHSCILLLFTIIDGVVADTKEIDGNKGFFAEGEEIYAWDSISAHKTGLTELRKLLYKNRGKTTSDEIEIPYRNGIMHGRDLEYANKKVATKLWATLFALKDSILAINKKGKEPPEPQEPLTVEKIVEWNETRNLRDKLFKEWENRHLKVNEDFPENCTPDDFEEELPEKVLVEFFEYWKVSNFGKMVEKLHYRFFDNDTPGKQVFELKTGIFKGKKIKNYSVLNIDDDSVMISDIKVNLTIIKDDEEISETIDFRMIYEREDGEIELRGMKNGSWKIYNGIYQIGEL